MAYVKKRGDSYFIRCSAGYDSTGKQIQKSMTWRIPEGMSPKKAEKEAHHQAAIFEEQVRNGEVYDGRLKFKDFAEKWFTDYAEVHLRPRTVTRYRECMQRINKAIGHIPINRIRPQHLIKFYNSLTDPIVTRTYTAAVDFGNLIETKGFTRSAFAKSCGVSEYAIRQLVNGKYIQEKPALKLSEALEIPLQELFNISESEHVLSQETILSHHRIISSIMSKAVKWQIIPSNPAERVEAPKVQKKEAVYLDEYQAVEMLAALENEPLQYRTAVYMLLYTGFRRGELLGLKWDDIDFDNNTIAVKRSVLYNSDMGVFEDETKNATSQRIIKVSAGVLSILRKYRVYQSEWRLKVGDLWHDEGWIFTTQYGKVMHPDTLSAWFRKFIDSNGLPPVHLHSLRHTNASLLIASGTNLQTVAKRLGHADATTTARIYSHAIQSADAVAAETLEDILKNEKR